MSFYQGDHSVEVKCMWDAHAAEGGCLKPATQWVTNRSARLWYPACGGSCSATWRSESIPIEQVPPGDHMWSCHHPVCVQAAGHRKDIENDLRHAEKHGFFFGFTPPTDEEVADTSAALQRLLGSFNAS